ncbi:hypothetical protein F0562_025039 [Nyssa sinensis]|uniref:Sulfotransferase n=1 Tax=Nyssa sinensis TaxID=561372 RepID=A0A5J5BEN7_9ASTE|nr:hypothetical protein F0562_025039 [Nyssa sinensis]
MAAAFPTQNSDSLECNKQEEGNNKTYQKDLDLIISALPKEKGWISENNHLYQGFWYPTAPLRGIITAQQHLKARPTDVFLVTIPKSGTTWFKALLFSIMNRTHYDYHTHPLLTTNPHECVPFLEVMYANENPNSNPNLPLLSTHIPYSALPKSILTSGCRVVYVFREPKDTFISLWHFTSKLRRKELPPMPLGEALELFCKGASPYGPFWDHVLGYWKASLERPDRVLFLKYEDMKSEPYAHAKRLAEFSGHPFSLEEEKEGVIGKILELCSFESLRSLEVNKTGSQCSSTMVFVPNSILFRQGKVGDWKNYLTAEMIEQIDQITKEKFKDLV